MIDKTNKALLKYWPILGLLGLGGVGGTGATVGNMVLGGLTDRLDAIIYIMCDEDDKCVDVAWEHIFEEKEKRRLRGQ